MTNEITKVEAKRYKECEALIETGADSMRRGLLEIRDSKLYRQDYKTFEEYCATRWNITARHANRMIAHAKVEKNLGQICPKNDCEDELFPEINQSQARELSKVEPEKQAEVLAKASENGKPTAAKIKEAAAEIEEEVEAPVDSVGQEIPQKLAGVFDMAEVFEEKARVLTSLKKWADEIEADETPGSMWLHYQTFRADLSNAQNALRQNKPFAVCPYCQAKKSKCDACKGVGYVTKRTYETAPSELRT